MRRAIHTPAAAPATVPMNPNSGMVRRVFDTQSLAVTLSTPIPTSRPTSVPKNHPHTMVPTVSMTNTASLTGTAYRLGVPAWNDRRGGQLAATE